MTTVLALDPGYGNTKVCLDGKVACLQSAIARPQEVGLAAIGMKTAAQVDILSIWRAMSLPSDLEPGIGAACSPAAITRPWPRSNGAPWRSVRWPPSSRLEAIVINHLVIGLPVPLLVDELQAKAVMEALKEYKQGHQFSINGEELRPIHRPGARPGPAGRGVR